MEAVMNVAITSGCKQAVHSAPRSCVVPSALGQISPQLRFLPCLRSRTQGLGSHFGGEIGSLERSAHRRVPAGGIRRSSGLECRSDLTELAELAPITAAVYGASLLGGGLFAFTRTGSKGSLGGGVTGGIALGVAFFLMQVPETRDLGQAIGFGSALLFAAIFGIRLVATGKPMPSGALLILSTVATIIFANAYFQARLPGPPM